VIYKLSDGTRVRVKSTENDGEYEFETYVFEPAKRTINVTRRAGTDAQEAISSLYVADAIRFGQQYGMRGSV
jgi:hypothetical protein